MEVKTYQPGEKLSKYVSCYFTLRSDNSIGYSGILIPAGHMEIAFNLGDSEWNSDPSNHEQRDPAIELLGQMTRPKAVSTAGNIDMFCVRFFPHTACYFINEELGIFKNQIAGLEDILGKPIQDVYARLLGTSSIQLRLEIIENYLSSRISVRTKDLQALNLVGGIAKELKLNGYDDQVKAISGKFGISGRYLQKLFLRYVGISPKLYLQISRFNESIRVMKTEIHSLTSVAYDCGYSDQSHFIKDFKTFSGLTPSAYLKESRSI